MAKEKNIAPGHAGEVWSIIPKRAAAIMAIGAVAAGSLGLKVFEKQPDTTVTIAEACVDENGETVPYTDDTKVNDRAIDLTASATAHPDEIELTCPDGTTPSNDEVRVVSDAASSVPGAEVTFGNSGNSIPVYEVKVDEESGTVTVHSDPMTSVKEVKTQ